MIITNPWVILIRFGKIRPLSPTKIGRSQPPLGREVRHIILSRVTDIWTVGLVVLKPLRLGELDLLVLVFEVRVTIR